MTDESIIIKQVLAGDTNAFATLVDRYKDLSITLAANILSSREDAEDVAQDAFIKAYSSLSSFKGDSKFSTWLYRVVLNTALNKRKVKKLDIVAIEEQIVDDEAITSPTDLRSYNQQEQKKYIQEALKNVHEGERVCLTLFYLHELTTEEIKELTGYSLSNIKVLLHRGRKQLYYQLEQLLQKELRNLL